MVLIGMPAQFRGCWWDNAHPYQPAKETTMGKALGGGRCDRPAQAPLVLHSAIDDRLRQARQADFHQRGDMFYR